MICPEPGCNDSASIAYTYTMHAAGPGSHAAESIIEMARVFCPSGHHLDVEVDSVNLE